MSIITVRGEQVALIAVKDRLSVIGKDRQLSIQEQRTFMAYLKAEGFLDNVKLESMFSETLNVHGMPITIAYGNGNPIIQSDVRYTPEEQKKIVHYLKAEGIWDRFVSNNEPEEPIL